jgi:hypothetical protein
MECLISGEIWERRLEEVDVSEDECRCAESGWWWATALYK